MQQTLIRLSMFFFTLAIAVCAAAQPVSRDLRVVFNSVHYLTTVYSGPSVPGAFVYFDDEPLRLQVGIVNWSDDTLTLRTRASASDVVSVRLYSVSDAGRVEVPARLSLSGDPLLTGESQQSTARWDEPIPIPAKWSVTIPMLVQADRLEPGKYELHLDQIRASCEPKCVIRNAVLFPFEIKRPDTLPKQLDRLVRLANEAIERGNVEDADPLLKQMLELYPQSSAAYQFIGRRAERLGNWKEAAVAYDRALTLFQTGADSLRPRTDPQALISGLRRQATAARRRPEKQ